MYTDMGKQKFLPALGLPMAGPTASPCPDFPFWLRRGVKFDALTTKYVHVSLLTNYLAHSLLSNTFFFLSFFFAKLLPRSIIHNIVYLRGLRLYAAPLHLLSIVPLATHVPVHYPDPPLRP